MTQPPPEGSTTRPTPGRPRDPATDERILAAARDLLAEVGYDATSIQAIARRAGVGVPSVYRRWSTKPALVEDAVFHLSDFQLPPATGDIEHDLAAWVARFLELATEPAARAAVPGLMVAYSQDPDSYSRLLDRGESPTREAMRAMLDAASELTPDVSNCDVDMAFDLLRGAVYLRALTHGADESEAYCERLTRALLAVVTTPTTV